MESAALIKGLFSGFGLRIKRSKSSCSGVVVVALRVVVQPSSWTVDCEKRRKRERTGWLLFDRVIHVQIYQRVGKIQKTGSISRTIARNRLHAPVTATLTLSVTDRRKAKRGNLIQAIYPAHVYYGNRRVEARASRFQRRERVPFRSHFSATCFGGTSAEGR